MADKYEIERSLCTEIIRPRDAVIKESLAQAIIQEGVIVEFEHHEGKTYLKVFSLEQIYLSTTTPIIDKLGFVIIDEVSYNLMAHDQKIFINRFTLAIEDTKQLTIAKVNVLDVITQVLRAEIKADCSLYQLIYVENFSIREVTLVRGFAEYLNQALISISYQSIVETFLHNAQIVKAFTHYFYTKFFPNIEGRERALKNDKLTISAMIKQVENILEDRVLNITFALLQNITRTNYYLGRPEIALKIDTQSIAHHFAGLQPNREIFVYHTTFSGLHLRMSNVSRGGLRWSDRYDDYRQEVKSLMFTQNGKNSIIVPNGAKGAFVIKEENKTLSKEAFQSYYYRFISNLLDVIDNQDANGEVIKNPSIVAYDEVDSYFVVAADKGTAAMSDVANSISEAKQFWLGDAFASGGSAGYSHKELGITAKGSLRSTERFFIEQGVHLYNDVVSVVGIGSMNGDVFGNGMLLSENFKLIGAISHKEIFVDPNPNIALSYAERKRLFHAKNGGWSEYDKRVISEGGGVFLRSQKSITITPQMQKTFGIKAKTLSGEALAQRLLTAKVDLLFNGGVGTYVKAEEENSIDIGDKQNEAVRVNASSLRATMVCEGGNLGFTQKARIEYAKNGGSINLDAIDNSAGVNTSDHEVNIKILLSSLLKKQVITTDERNKILGELTDPVVKQVLRSNYEQALAISLDSERSKESLKPFIKTVEILEKSLDDFNRRDFVLPKKDAAFEEMLTPDGALVRPHLASLILYAKLFVKRIILQSDLLTRPYISGFVYKYFPKSFTTVYKHEIAHHPLKNQIIATVLADRMINQQGSTFINDHELLGDKGFALKIKAFLISNSLLGANNIRHQIYRQDYVMRTAEQYPLLFELEESVAFSAKWILHHLERDSSLEAHMILEYQERIMNVLNADIFHSKKRTINDKTLHHYYTRLPYLKFATTVIELNQKTLQSFEAKAMIFFLVLKKFSILTLLEALEAQHHLSSEQKTLQEQLQKFIEHAVITLTNKIVAFGRENEEPKAVVDAYLLAHATTLTPTLTRLDEFGLMEKKTLESIAITVNDLVLGTM